MKYNFLSLQTQTCTHVMDRVCCMQYKWDAYHSSNDMNHKTIQRDMKMRADNKPWKRRSGYEKNEGDIITSRMINMIMGTGSGTKAILLITMKPHTGPYLMELRKIFVRKLLATCTSFSEGIL